MAALYEANTTFALEMYKKIIEEKKGGNIFISPLSMSLSLSMVLFGAKGNTAAQMSKALHCDKVGKAPGIPGEELDQPFSGMDQKRVMQQRTCVGMEQRKDPHHHHHHQQHHHHSAPQRALQLDKCEDVHSLYQELITAINSPSAVGTLKMANRLFGEQTHDFSQDYITAIKKFYHAEPEALDFVGAPDSARTHINEWVEGQTQGTCSAV
ncbi:leukocyte elastase inhibitor-like [Protopterus annectens]|uniref:leukocyte elastase inhibitor-like n=1 Tax=Protopterus annectens TaxID=7888 RepID=UPI001CF9309D|nr:leukocyte elastase inhibitor-like [Protopterus annectens]